MDATGGRGGGRGAGGGGRREGEFGCGRGAEVLEKRKCVRDGGRRKVESRRQHLPELDEERTEIIERAPQPDAARRGQVSPEQQVMNEEPQGAQPRMAERELVETVPLGDDEDSEKPTQPHAGIVRCRR